MPKKTVLITGANGFLGGELVTYFASRGWSVVGCVRSPEPLKATAPPHVTYAAYDLAKPFDAGLCKGVDLVIHTAYMKFDRNHPEAMKHNISASRSLHEAARAHNVKRMVFMSSMSAHKDAVSVYGKQKLAIEAIFSNPADTVLRSGLIIGQGGIVQEMVGFLKTKRLVPLVDGGKQPLQVISVHDLVRIIEQVYTKGLGGTFTVANPRIYAYKELYQTIAQNLGISILYVPVPFAVLLLAIRMLTALRLPLPVNEDNLQGLKMLRSADNAADMAKIGLPLDDLASALSRAEVK